MEELQNLKEQYKQEKKEISKKRKALKKERIRLINTPPRRGVLEEIGNAVTHGVGALLGILGLILLLLKSDTNLTFLIKYICSLETFLVLVIIWISAISLEFTCWKISDL